ncbi:MAG: type II toxin-antitoxin system HicA family toxin [Candidatus Taylorbacteria bacterium]|nr:type II toxin-antitoxin system HicA family toxin [Candidatus Taylorbacteria bacterium]
MQSIQPISPSRLIKAMEKLGYIATRQRGSHVTMINHEKKSRTCVSVHSSKVNRNIIRKILKQIDVSEEEFLGVI